ncbi:Regulator of chromosome condensation, RCC1 [Dillenia turbinata]|uniref:Regulator of chromosome condensation, RCC1 n=1 Tax=Dillenia turbinata TaxID=194707 RepID=A0AAN8ZSU1_9MAGN
MNFQPFLFLVYIKNKKERRMDGLSTPQAQKHNLLAPRKNLSIGPAKDLWLIVRESSLADVDAALMLLKKNCGNVNARNPFGLTLLHIATWRNHVPIVRRLLAAGADPDARDGESGWSSLHRALHFGHLAVASVLLQSGASITIEDSKCRTPIDLLSGPVLRASGPDCSSVATELFSWGSGANYQLGTGNAHMYKLPCKVDSLHGSFIKLISAAKFHSVAVSALGEVYTWGFGRGGRLGHPEFDIHSGQAAVITPRIVTDLGSRRIKAVAAAKHHTAVATEGGEVFTWGSNREGQLGYTSVDTQPTPRRVSSLKSKIVAVAAANKHTAVVSETGEVFTWGCNKEGQLGYGTSNSASNYTPRVVEYLKGKVFTGVSAAKYHTLVLAADGEVFTWGHRLVTPKRVAIARNLKKLGTSLLKFHRMRRLHVVAIAAGMVHSTALTEDGALFYWVSSDPDLRCRQLYSLCGRNVISVAAGKYWTAAATTTGDVYMWDGKNNKGEPPVITRLQGVKRATSVSVGETHLLIVASLYHPIYPPSKPKNPQKPKSEVANEYEELDEGFMFNDMESDKTIETIENEDVNKKSILSLKSLCEKVAIEFLVVPQNAISLLEIADSLGADDVKKHCEDMAIRNLDYIFTVASNTIANASLDVLANLEKMLDLRSSESWSYRRLPTTTATFPVVVDSEECENETLRTRDSHAEVFNLRKGGYQTLDSFLQSRDDKNNVAYKQARALRKKLQQIEILEAKQSNGHPLDDQQIAKLHTRSALERSLAELGVPLDTAQTNAQEFPDGKGSKKGEASKKQRRKSKQKAAQVEIASGTSGMEQETVLVKGFLDVELSQASKQKEEVREIGPFEADQVKKDSLWSIRKRDNLGFHKSRSSTTASKKKNRKGGLSMFLSGALDDNPKEVIPPPPMASKCEGPAWGGAKLSKTSASLRDIQDEQSKVRVNPMPRSNEKMDEHSEIRNDGKIKLASFLLSCPIPVSTPRTPQLSDGEKSTPPWAPSGTPPLLSRPSLRDIQMQQGKQHQSLSHSPKTRTTGFSVSTSQGSPSESSGMNRWFKPEVSVPSSIRLIQIEEKAMKDLKRFYSSVKFVKNQT